MTTEKNNFLQSLFHSLKLESYILLKWLRADLSNLAEESDLDILVKPSAVKKIVALISETESIQKVEEEKRLGVNHYYLYFKNGDFLQIDLLFKFIRKDLIYLSTKEVFENSIEINGIKTYNHSTLLEHVLLFNMLNNSGLPVKYLPYFKSLSQKEQAFILNKFNYKYGTTFTDLAATLQFSQVEQSAIYKYLNSLKENSLLKKANHQIDYLINIYRQIRENQGQIITFSGVDGAGKSTIIKDMLDLLGRKYRKKVIVLRHRPSLLPIISAWRYGKEKAEQKSVERLPRQGGNKSSISSYARFAYYYLDYLLGQFYVWAKYLVKGYTVLYDRYYFDFIIDGKRSNISITSRLPKWLYTFVAKPKLNFFLYADATTILARKQELDASVIKQLTERYQSLFKEFDQKHSGTYLPIENIDKATTLQTILNHTL